MKIVLLRYLVPVYLEPKRDCILHRENAFAAIILDGSLKST